MPLYGSQTVTNSPLVSAGPGDVNEVLAFNAETPQGGQASIAIPISTRPFMNGPVAVSLQFEDTNMGSGAFQIQDSDNDIAGDYTSINFGGATPGSVAAGQLNASGVGRVELLISGRFLRLLCTTAPTGAITVRVRQK